MNASTATGGILARDPQISALWEKLRQLAFDGGSGPQTFAARLSREQGWSVEFTAQAIEEYRRFLLLFALEHGRVTGVQPTVGNPPAVRIVPSAVVDKVWHLHLLYTRSYWESLCRDLVGAPLHHLPAEGAGGEESVLDTVYQETLARYHQVFGQPAPEAVWPAPASIPPPRLSTSPSNNARFSPAPASRGAGFPWVIIVLGVGAILWLALAQIWDSTGTPAAVSILAMIGGLVCVALARLAALGARGGNGFNGHGVSHRHRHGAVASDGGGCSGGAPGGSDDGVVTHSAHTGAHDGGHHDGGGHGHSCGGHSCGGHSCGGHGCGGSCGGH